MPCHVMSCAFPLLTPHPIHTHTHNTKKSAAHLTMGELALCLASWGQYVLGMVVYAKGWPRLSPRHFSSHEVRGQHGHIYQPPFNPPPI